MKKLLLSILLVVSISANAQFWTEKATGFTTADRTLSSISIVDTNVSWAIALDNSAPIDYTIKEFTKSIDGGETWTSGTINLGANTTGLGITSISAISDQIAWISVADADVSDLGGIWKTTDGGLTWIQQTSALFNNPLESYTNFVHFWDASNGVAGGDTESGNFEIYTTSDGGTIWDRVVGATNIPASTEGETGFMSGTSVIGDTFWFSTSSGRIFKSNNKGLTWTVNTTPTPSPDFAFGLDKFTFSDSSKGILMIEGTQKIYRTNDGGETWNLIVTPDFYKTNIAYIPNTSTVIAGAAANPFGSSYSTDDGVTWTTIDNGIFHGTLAFLNDSFGFSAGLTTEAIPPTTPPTTTGGIYKFFGIPLKTANFDLKKQIFAYPNPTNGILHLDSEVSSFKGAAIFDLLGKQVYSSKFSNLNKADLDLNSLQTGNYILKVTSDSGKTETVKIMKN
jgi:photosystem II stability/assembly factor-like uncharacterized protein